MFLMSYVAWFDWLQEVLRLNAMRERLGFEESENKGKEGQLGAAIQPKFDTGF